MYSTQLSVVSTAPFFFLDGNDEDEEIINKVCIVAN